MKLEKIVIHKRVVREKILYYRSNDFLLNTVHTFILNMSERKMSNRVSSTEQHCLERHNFKLKNKSQKHKILNLKKPTVGVFGRNCVTNPNKYTNETSNSWVIIGFRFARSISSNNEKIIATNGNEHCDQLYSIVGTAVSVSDQDKY